MTHDQTLNIKKISLNHPTRSALCHSLSCYKCIINPVKVLSPSSVLWAGIPGNLQLAEDRTPQALCVTEKEKFASPSDTSEGLGEVMSCLRVRGKSWEVLGNVSLVFRD